MSSLTLDWLNIAVLLGAAQGYLLAAVLATLRRNRTANRLLAVAVFSFSIQMSMVVFYALRLHEVVPHLFGLAFPLPLIYGPLIYLYAVCTSDRTRRLRWWDAQHFVPFVGVVLAGLPVYLMSGPEKIEFYQLLQRGERPPIVLVTDVLKYGSGITYTAITLLFLTRHRTRVKDSYSSVERVNLQWLFHLAWAAAVIWVGAALFHVTDAVGRPLLERPDDIIALATAILVYGIGYRALRQPEVFNVATGEFPAVRETTMSHEGAVAAAPPGQPAPRYERSGLGDSEADALKGALVQSMERDRCYRDPDLALPELATRLGTTPHKLSEVLNAQLEQSFYDSVNGYRVREVQQRLTEHRSDALTLLSLASDAGFASKSTFNSVFKKVAGVTPSEYRRSLGRDQGAKPADR
jgi:AraC-like DNA-binding protein